MAMGGLTVQLRIDPLVERLVRRTMTTLDRADQDDAIGQVCGLLESGRLLDIGVLRPGVMAVTLRPYAELALREVCEIGGDGRLDDATKARRIQDVFRLAGVTAGSCA